MGAFQPFPVVCLFSFVLRMRITSLASSKQCQPQCQHGTAQHTSLSLHPQIDESHGNNYLDFFTILTGTCGHDMLCILISCTGVVLHIHPHLPMFRWDQPPLWFSYCQDPWGGANCWCQPKFRALLFDVCFRRARIQVKPKI